MYQLRGSIPIILQVGNNFADHGEPTRACMIAEARGTNGTAAIYDGVVGESTIEKSVSSHWTGRGLARIAQKQKRPRSNPEPLGYKV